MPLSTSLPRGGNGGDGGGVEAAAAAEGVHSTTSSRDNTPPPKEDSYYYSDLNKSRRLKSKRRSTELTVDETVLLSGEFSIQSLSSCCCSDEDDEELLSSPRAVHPQIIARASTTSSTGSTAKEEEPSPATAVPLLRDEDEEQDEVEDEALLFFSAQEYQPQNSLEKVQREIKLQKELLLWKKHEVQQQHQQKHCRASSSSPSSDSTSTTTSSSRRLSRLQDYLRFELQYSLPGSAALLLTCLAHASTYEGISNLAYEAVEHEAIPHKAWVYTFVLVLGCLLARISGAHWEFISPKHYRRVQFDLHNRLRLRTLDTQWCRQFQNKCPELLQGLIQIAAFYLCYVALTFYLQQVAIHVDQRHTILANLPSNLYQQQQQIHTMKNDDILLFCPAKDYSPHALFGGSNHSSSPTMWDPLGDCMSDSSSYHTTTTPTAATQDSEDDDDEDEDLLWAFGPEDDRYFYQRLSKNSYEKFFGQDYEAAMFDTTHHVLFYATVVGLSMGLLKVVWGVSFWANW